MKIFKIPRVAFFELEDLLYLCIFFFQKPKEPVPTLAPKTLSVAAAFNEDEDVSNKPVITQFKVPLV